MSDKSDKMPYFRIWPLRQTNLTFWQIWRFAHIRSGNAKRRLKRQQLKIESYDTDKMTDKTSDLSDVSKTSDSLGPPRYKNKRSFKSYNICQKYRVTLLIPWHFHLIFVKNSECDRECREWERGALPSQWQAIILALSQTYANRILVAVVIQTSYLYGKVPLGLWEI